MNVSKKGRVPALPPLIKQKEFIGGKRKKFVYLTHRMHEGMGKRMNNVRY